MLSTLDRSIIESELVIQNRWERHDLNCRWRRDRSTVRISGANSTNLRHCPVKPKDFPIQSSGISHNKNGGQIQSYALYSFELRTVPNGRVVSAANSQASGSGSTPAEVKTFFRCLFFLSFWIKIQFQIKLIDFQFKIFSNKFSSSGISQQKIHKSNSIEIKLILGEEKC